MSGSVNAGYVDCKSERTPLALRDEVGSVCLSSVWVVQCFAELEGALFSHQGLHRFGSERSSKRSGNWPVCFHQCTATSYARPSDARRSATGGKSGGSSSGSAAKSCSSSRSAVTALSFSLPASACRQVDPSCRVREYHDRGVATVNPGHMLSQLILAKRPHMLS